MNEKLTEELNIKKENLKDIQMSGMNMATKLDTISKKRATANIELQKTQKKGQKLKLDFEKIKKQRCDTFKKAFDHISSVVGDIYKSLNRNDAAQAYLLTVNPEEPYLDGISYHCVVPGKRFQLMDNLSGGEKTFAALTLLFAIHSYQPAPFIVMDEIDASLDNSNIIKLASYIVHKMNRLQSIVISLNVNFFGHAELLVGVSNLRVSLIFWVWI